MTLAGHGWPGGRERQTEARSQIPDAIGSIGFFYGAPQPDENGSRVLYLRPSEQGVGLYRHELASGKTALLNEWKVEEAGSLDGLSLWPLSPGDRFLPVLVSPGSSAEALAIHEAASGKELARIAAPGVAEGAWLAAEKLAWLARKPSQARKVAECELHVVQRQPNQSWADTCALVALTNASCLAGLSDDTVAWMDPHGVYVSNLVSNRLVTLCNAEEKPLHQMSYHRKTGQFLVTRKEKNGYSLWRLKLRTDGTNEFSQLTSDKDIQSAQWINEGRGFAYLSHQTLVVRTNAASQDVQFKAAEVHQLAATPAGGGLFVVGAVGDKLGLGLWRYQLKSRGLTNVLDGSDQSLAPATRVRPIHWALQVGRRQRLECYLYRPAHFDWSKKYPLLIGDSVFERLSSQGDFDGPSWAQAMANCGAYVVMVERRAWLPRDADEWGWDVLILYNKLKEDPTIDTSRVFLWGVSPESAYLGRLLNRKPGLWKGVLLLSPQELPDPRTIHSLGHFPKMLISAGKDEHRSEEFKRFQEAACRRGLRVEVVEHPNATLRLASLPALQDRLRTMARFVFEE